jgi:hypothetical protein
LPEKFMSEDKHDYYGITLGISIKLTLFIEDYVFEMIIKIRMPNKNYGQQTGYQYQRRRT